MKKRQYSVCLVAHCNPGPDRKMISKQVRIMLQQEGAIDPSMAIEVLKTIVKAHPLIGLRLLTGDVGTKSRVAESSDNDVARHLTESQREHEEVE